MKPLTNNQFSDPIIKTIDRILNLNWKPLYLLPSGIEFIALAIVLIIFVLLWPYGIFPITATFIWQLIEDNLLEIKGKAFSTAMPYTVSIGVYFFIWLPFFIICLPCYLFGFIGKGLTGFEKDNNSSISMTTK